MINRLNQFNVFQDKFDLLFYYLCTFFQSLSIDRETALVKPFFIVKNISNKYHIYHETEKNFEIIISEIMRELFFFQKIYSYCYFENNYIRLSFFHDKTKIKYHLPDCTAKLIIFNYDEIQIFDKNFQQLLKELPNYSKEMNFEEKTKFHIRMLKLSKKIPFNAYTYCDKYITKAYFRYNEIQLLEHKAKIVQYILDKLNEGIKNLIGSDEIKIHGNFSLEEITKKKEELKNHN